MAVDVNDASVLCVKNGIGCGEGAASLLLIADLLAPRKTIELLARTALVFTISCAVGLHLVAERKSIDGKSSRCGRSVDRCWRRGRPALRPDIDNTGIAGKNASLSERLDAVVSLAKFLIYTVQLGLRKLAPLGAC